MTHPRLQDRRDGFSRIELLIVVAVIATIAAILIPCVQSAREAARRVQCQDHLHNLGVALLNYESGWQSFPPGCVGNVELPLERRWSWYPLIGNDLQHWGYPLHMDRAWDDPDIQPLRMSTWSNGPLRIYETDLYAPMGITCPSGTPAMHPLGQQYTDYVGMGGDGNDAPFLPRDHQRAGMWAYETVTRSSDCTDGYSNTLFVIETSSDRGCWLAGGSATVRPVMFADELPIGKGRQFGGLHPGGAMALYVDGRVDFTSNSIASSVFRQAATIAGGRE